jgi:hypothetical protein
MAMSDETIAQKLREHFEQHILPDRIESFEAHEWEHFEEKVLPERIAEFERSERDEFGDRVLSELSKSSSGRSGRSSRRTSGTRSSSTRARLKRRTLDLRLHYRTLGALAPDRSNAVLMLHGTTGESRQFFAPECCGFLVRRWPAT